MKVLLNFHVTSHFVCKCINDMFFYWNHFIVNFYLYLVCFYLAVRNLFTSSLGRWPNDMFIYFYSLFACYILIYFMVLCFLLVLVICVLSQQFCDISKKKLDIYPVFS